MFKQLFICCVVLSLFSNKTASQINAEKNIALYGYDVVSYFENSPAKGDFAYSTTYNGTRFLFRNTANKNAFENEPEKYLPQYGGYCAYAMAVNGTLVAVNPESYELRAGKLYLFYKTLFSNTLARWQKADTAKLILKANMNWREHIVKS